MAWLYVARLGPEGAIDRAARGIRILAEANGKAALYHDTVTRAWVYLVAAAVARSSASSEGFLARNPQLLDERLLLEYYSPNVLASSQARAAWMVGADGVAACQSVVADCRAVPSALGARGRGFTDQWESEAP
jgi:hypothetical protein